MLTLFIRIIFKNTDIAIFVYEPNIYLRTGHTDDKLITVQLGDETDSKMMLGSYHCTDIPGEFVWQPGALTKVCY